VVARLLPRAPGGMPPDRSPLVLTLFSFLSDQDIYRQIRRFYENSSIARSVIVKRLDQERKTASAS